MSKKCLLQCEQSTPTHETKASDTVETSATDDAIDNAKDDDTSPAAESPNAQADEDSAEPGLDDTVVATAAADGQRVTTQVIERLATLVSESWVKLATRLHFQQDDIVYFQTENSTPAARASKMLTIWAVSTSCHVFYFLLRLCVVISRGKSSSLTVGGGLCSLVWELCPLEVFGILLSNMQSLIILGFLFFLC